MSKKKLPKYDEDAKDIIKIKEIKPRNKSQEEYLNIIEDNTVVFGVGPSGVGKSFIPCYYALKSYNEGKYDKIVICRPTVLAADDVGYLSGDLNEKLAPHMFALFDSFEFLLGKEQFEKMMFDKQIVVLSIAHMRGSSISNALIIADEVQNLNTKQAKMLLTRIGHNSKMILTLDPEQTDLDYRQTSFADDLDRFRDEKNIGFFEFSYKDVVRSEIVRTVLKCYNKKDNQIQKGEDNRKTYESNWW